jgi:ketosteroid isomerase-like protein
MAPTQRAQKARAYDSPMSGANVESVRRYFEALRRRDFDAAVAEWQPECEWLPETPGLIEAASYRGHDGLRGYFAMMMDLFESVRINLSELREIGDRVVALGDLRVHSRGSGLELDEQLGIVFEMRGGKIARARSYRDRAQALAAADGLG